MKYYHITNTYSQNSSTADVYLQIGGRDPKYNDDGYLDYPEPLKLFIRGEEKTKSLFFRPYNSHFIFIANMIPEIKEVFESFSMPNVHKWFKAEAGYDLEFVNNMRKFFNIEYDIDMNEKREYWVLQLLNHKREELAYDLIEFYFEDYNTDVLIEGVFLEKGSINTYEEYRAIRKKEIETNSRRPLPKSYIYRKNYDILWGGIYIIFNEKVKAALESTGIITPENGLKFEEFTEYKIEMLGE